MNWDNDALHSAALKLLLLVVVTRNRVTTSLLDELEELGYIAPGRGMNEFFLLVQYQEKFRQYLSPRWSEFAAAEAAFSARPEAISPEALRQLRRANLNLPIGITQVNRRTWSAWAGAHSKSRHCSPPEGITLTSDEALRLRANAGLQFVGQDDVLLAANACQQMFGEVIIPERGLARDWHVAGVLPKLILTVENIGAYIDLSIPEWMMLVHAPGRNTALATRFIDRLPVEIPWAHFGDLDPAGFDIALSIHGQNSSRKPVPWIPSLTRELLETHTLPLEMNWRVHLLPPDLIENPVLRWLILHNRWLEHEAAVLLPGFVDELRYLVRNPF